MHSSEAWEEFAARQTGEEPGGAARVKSGRHDCPARYFDRVRDTKHPYGHRLRLVESAKQRGIKTTARLFATTSRIWPTSKRSGLCSNDFLAKVHTYQLYFNLARPNSPKEF
jgi:hypothetical protein